MINIKKISKVIEETEQNVDYIKSISDSIVDTYTKDLDELMRDINKDIIANNNVSDKELEKYFLELTNAIYFIGAKCEALGIYEDISKSNAKLKYNKAFTENQINNVLNKSKPTIAENQIYAENESLDETLTNYIYSRSFKIIKTKLESSNEMIKTLSKIITKRISDNEKRAI